MSWLLLEAVAEVKENCLVSKTKANESGWLVINCSHLSEIAEEQIGDTGFPESYWKHSDYAPFCQFLSYNRELKQIPQTTVLN